MGRGLVRKHLSRHCCFVLFYVDKKGLYIYVNYSPFQSGVVDYQIDPKSIQDMF